MPGAPGEITLNLARPDRAAELAGLMQADGHAPIQAIWTVNKGPEIVGAVSLRVMPVVGIWLDSKRVRIGGTVAAMVKIQEGLRELGWRQALVPCQVTSPLFKHMTRLGLEALPPMFAKKF